MRILNLIHMWVYKKKTKKEVDNVKGVKELKTANFFENL